MIKDKPSTKLKNNASLLTHTKHTLYPMVTIYFVLYENIMKIRDKILYNHLYTPVR